MKYFKDSQNNVFAFDDDVSAEERPPLLTPITKQEADQLARQVAATSPQQQIEALEREHMAPRWQREFALGAMEREAVELGVGQGATPEQSIAILRSKNAGYRRLKELDEQIEVLRGQL